MAVNQSHSENRKGAIIPYGESVLDRYPDVDLSFPQQDQGSNLFSGTKKGMLFLTSYRVIFVTSHLVNDPMLSFMMPFNLMSNCTIEQPVFAANYFKGTIRAAPDGGWEGQATFKLAFRKGGAVQFSQLLMRAAAAAAQGVPLTRLNYWLGTPGLFVITGQCNQGVPCPVYPVAVYGSQRMRYGAPPAAYRAPPGNGVPPPEYRAPPPGYGAPPPGYGAPPPGYGAPQPGYGAPHPGYGASPPGYGAPHPGYGAPPPGYGGPQEGSEAPPAGYGATPARYGALHGGYGP